MLLSFGRRGLGTAPDIDVGLVVLGREQRTVRRQGRGGIIVHSSASFDVCSGVRRVSSHMLCGVVFMGWEKEIGATLDCSLYKALNC